MAANRADAGLRTAMTGEIQRTGVSQALDLVTGNPHLSEAILAGAELGTSLGAARLAALRAAASEASIVTTVAPKSGLGRVVGTADAINPGSLVDDLAGTFSGGRYREVILEADTVLYRAGTANKPFGQFFSSEAPAGILQTRIDKAVLPRWPGGGTSPIDTGFALQIPKGTRVFVGEVGSQGGMFVGGTQQIVVVKPWTIKGVEVLKSFLLQ
jgi:hypothetical protein